MSLKVIDKDCRVQENKLIIVVEGSNPGEVTSTEANHIAVSKAASLGYSRVGINNHSGSYPVDSEGNQYEDWNEQSRKGLISAYRNDIALMGGI